MQAQRKAPLSRDVAEWAGTILVLLFGTTTIAQPFVVPTGSMENNILIGDHLIVDKLAYAPPGKLGRYILPSSEVRRGDVIVFRYPLDLTQTYYWSYETSTENLAEYRLEHFQDLALNFFTKTRWSRTFQFVRGYPLVP